MFFLYVADVRLQGRSNRTVRGQMRSTDYDEDDDDREPASLFSVEAELNGGIGGGGGSVGLRKASAWRVHRSGRFMRFGRVGVRPRPKTDDATLDAGTREGIKRYFMRFGRAPDADNVESVEAAAAADRSGVDYSKAAALNEAPDFDIDESR